MLSGGQVGAKVSAPCHTSATCVLFLFAQCSQQGQNSTKKELSRCDNSVFLCVNYLLPSLSVFSHVWLAIPQLVLQADWQEVWHSPHPPFLALSQRLRVSNVTMCFIFSTLRECRFFCCVYRTTKVAKCQQFCFGALALLATFLHFFCKYLPLGGILH